MNKSELIQELAQVTGKTNAEVDQLINSFLTIVSEKLQMGRKIQIKNFGTFQTKYSVKRSAINPRTLETVIVPARYKVTFTPSKSLMDKVNRIIDICTLQ